MANHLAVCISYVAAIIGTVGLSLAILSAVPPSVVNATIAFDFEMSATYKIQRWRKVTMHEQQEDDFIQRGDRLLSDLKTHIKEI